MVRRETYAAATDSTATLYVPEEFCHLIHLNLRQGPVCTFGSPFGSSQQQRPRFGSPLKVTQIMNDL